MPERQPRRNTAGIASSVRWLRHAAARDLACVRLRACRSGRAPGDPFRSELPRAQDALARPRRSEPLRCGTPDAVNSLSIGLAPDTMSRRGRPLRCPRECPHPWSRRGRWSNGRRAAPSPEPSRPAEPRRQTCRAPCLDGSELHRGHNGRRRTGRAGLAALVPAASQGRSPSRPSGG
jgi:hypothetical protein